uniref:non-specific serine/threonine protein kinase n=1 Tax=Mucochytrium quahogii TaxID=96639 RepID=A0A7S2RIM9_9STRA|mmetsp:Transcript_15776/g.34087  ORF Transcript_15776/g.34087 Transcript_15776/m.34087 type:complete len:1018 (+) Transcript_15776:23-3076(+)
MFSLVTNGALVGTLLIGEEGSVKRAIHDIESKKKEEIVVTQKELTQGDLESITELLKDDGFVKKLRFCGCSLNSVHATLIVDMLKVNSTLTELYFDDKNIPNHIKNEIELLLSANRNPKDNGGFSQANWYYLEKSCEHGPFSESEMRQKYIDGNLIPTVMVKCNLISPLRWHELQEYFPEIENAFITEPTGKASLIKNEKGRLEKCFVDAIENRDLETWGRARLMVVGEGGSGKTSTVRSLLGMEPVKEHISTQVADISVVHSRDWVKRPIDANDFDLLAHRAAARRARVSSKRTCDNSLVSKERHDLSKSARSSVHGPFAGIRRCSSSPSTPFAPSRPLLEQEEVAKRFDFETLKSLASETETGLEVSYTIWDYGGQRVFYALHHIFLTHQGLYLVVFSLKKMLEKQAMSVEFLKFWLNSTKLHASDAPVILVGTHLDEIKTNQREQLDVINTILLDKVKVLKYRVIPNRSEELFCFPINNNDPSVNRAQELRKLINQTTLEQEYINRKVPLVWLKVLDDMFAAKKAYFSLDRVLKIAREYGVEPDEVGSMLKMFHDLGVVIHQQATPNLHGVVVVDPQWLLSKLACLIGDEHHIRKLFFRKDIIGSNWMNDLNNLRERAVATRSLLEFLWEREQVDYLIDFMKDTMLLCDFEPTEEGPRYLVTSLVTEDVAIDLSEFESKSLTCIIDFSEFFLPDGIFLRLVSTATALTAEGSEPEVGRAQAVVEVRQRLELFSDGAIDCPEGFVAFVEKGDKIFIKIQFDAVDAPGLLKLVLSMFLEQTELLFKGLPLKWKLLLESPTDPLIQVEYKRLLAARERKQARVTAANRRIKVETSAFDPFFVNLERDGELDSEKEGSQVYRIPMKKLGDEYEYHVFISHKQWSGGDMAALLAERLTSRGLSVWYDQNHEDELNIKEMLEGIRKSKVYLLLLTRDIFSGTVLKELEHAKSLNKQFLLVHEKEPQRPGYQSIPELISEVSKLPESLQNLFDFHESLEFQRRKFLADAFLLELIKRINNA